MYCLLNTSIVASYVESIKDVPELLDMLSAPKAAAGDKIVYEEHLSPAQIQNGIKKGNLIQASFNISLHNVLEVIRVTKQGRIYTYFFFRLLLLVKLREK